MEYIILDLEWNQPTSYQSSVFRKVGDRLLFEMIQIGAVKMNEQLKITDSISIPICPTHYQKIHPRIARMTQLTDDVLREAPKFDEAMSRFASWCGQEYALITWGCDDVSVLQQNLDFFKTDVQLSRLYDLQRMFSAVMNLGKDRKGLKAAMDMLSITPDEEKSFHNALNDAYYTALVFQKMPCPSDILLYGQQARKLVHLERRRRRSTPMMEVEGVLAGLETKQAQLPQCPMCGHECRIEKDGYVMQALGRYVALASCKEHGMLFIRARFMPMGQEKKVMALSVAMATKQNVAYVHTKQLQRKNSPVSVNEEALESMDRGSMPFEDE